jgi:tight adherence protein C
MVVCVEAGLTVDAAMQRVGQELAIAHPAVSREFGISHMETRVGLSRSQALKNLGERTGNAALQSLATMLIQADRFGTSIAQALRVHSDTLRTQRQQLAEESAAKATVKLSFPLVLFIFPATFIVLVGPTIVNIAHSELMK